MTSLRFAAAAFVVVHHAFGPDDVPIVDLGYLGVTFFFVLSGFVLTWSGSADHGAGPFYRNRVARIVPLHYLTLVAAIFIPLAMTGSTWLFVQNLALLQAWSPAGAHSFNWVSWSISAEAFFYLVFPWLLRGLRRLGDRALMLLAVGSWLAMAVVSQGLRIFAPDVQFFFSYDFPPYRLGEFVIGVILALLMRRGWAPAKRVLGLAVVAGVALVVAILVADLFRPGGRDQFALLATPAVVVLLYVVVSAESARDRWWLTSRPLRRLGEWSFALYLVHALVIRLIGAMLGQSEAGYLPFGWAMVACLVSVALSAALCEGVEKPLERRLRSRSRGGN